MGEKKKVSLSGIQPSGLLQLGNYLGAVKNWDILQNEYDCIYFIANAHALTVRQDPKELKKNTLSALALILACGVDPNKSIAFIQSQVPQHFELSWILSCYTYFGELSRMTQFKDKSAKNADNINAGLFTYPSLMAADILLYQADVVPVGDDQRQHLEITRNLAERFNNAHGQTFTVPEAYTPKSGARIMSLTDPTSKMSKSDPNPKSYVAILDEPNTIIKKFKSAVTDSEMKVEYREGDLDKAGVNNLLTIYSSVTSKTIAEAAHDFSGKGYGDFKTAVGESVAELFRPIREQHDLYMSDLAELEKIATQGAERANIIAERTLAKVCKKIGIIRKF